jgi:hypothetical protein
VAAAWAGGMNNVDVYMFLSGRCGDSGATQVARTVEYLKNNNVRFGQLWLDIEGGSAYWQDHAHNIAVINSAISTGHKLGVKMAVYTSESQWTPITGGVNLASSMVWTLSCVFVVETLSHTFFASY